MTDRAFFYGCGLDPVAAAEWERALAPKDARVKQERCIYCSGRGRRSTWVNEMQCEVEDACPDCDGSGCLPLPAEEEPRRAS